MFIVKKLGMLALVGCTIVGGAIATTGIADARGRGHGGGYHGGGRGYGIGAGVAAGLALGALGGYPQALYIFNR